MKKSFKRVAAAAMAMALTAASSVSVFAMEKSTYTGQLNANDLKITVDLPADGALTMKPYAKEQVSTALGLNFANKSEDTTYSIELAGYTCVVTPKVADDKAQAISVSATPVLSGSATKVFTATAQIGRVHASGDAVTTEATAFKGDFTSATPAAMVIAKSSTASYDGKNVTAYQKNDAVSGVAIAPGESAPFRITGTMNASAPWTAGDKVVIVPVFNILPQQAQ